MRVWLSTRVRRFRPVLLLAFAVPFAYCGLFLCTVMSVSGQLLIRPAVAGGMHEANSSNGEWWHLGSVRIGVDGSREALWHGVQVRDVVEDGSSAAPFWLPWVVGASAMLTPAIIGWILILTGWLLRRRPLASFALVAFGALSVLDAPLILLRSAVSEDGGPVATLLMRSDLGWFRIPVLLGGGAALAVVVVVIATSLFRRTEDILGPLSRAAATLVACALALMASLLAGLSIRAEGAISFTPVLLVPVLLVSVSFIATGIFLVRRRRRETPARLLPCWSWMIGLCCGWTLVVVVVAVLLASGLHEGIKL